MDIKSQLVDADLTCDVTGGFCNKQEPTVLYHQEEKMAKSEKCAHPSCQCEAKAGSKYCSTYCEGEAHTSDIICNCGHPACKDIS